MKAIFAFIIVTTALTTTSIASRGAETLGQVLPPHAPLALKVVHVAGLFTSYVAVTPQDLEAMPKTRTRLTRDPNAIRSYEVAVRHLRIRPFGTHIDARWLVISFDKNGHRTSVLAADTYGQVVQIGGRSYAVRDAARFEASLEALAR